MVRLQRREKAGREPNRAYVVEENERSDHPPLGVGQAALDLETAEVAPPLVNEEFDY